MQLEIPDKDLSKRSALRGLWERVLKRGDKPGGWQKEAKREDTERKRGSEKGRESKVVQASIINHLLLVSPLTSTSTNSLLLPS